MSHKVIVITGASAGIGAALAERLAPAGATLVLVARRAEKLSEVVARCGPKAFAIVADVSSRDDVKRVVAKTLARTGRIDVWVNNVGQGISRMPSQLTDADIDAVMQVNVKSALYGMQEVLPHFKSRGDGHIINVSSMLGRVPFATIRSAYCGAKHFLNALTATFRAEVQAEFPGDPVLTGLSRRGADRFRAERHARGPRLAQFSRIAERRGSRWRDRRRYRVATARRVYAILAPPA